MSDDSATPASPASPEAEIPQVHDEEFSIVYSNWIQAGRTSWDIALLFGMARETSPGVPVINHLVNVVMTPAMAKALVGTLALTVKAYEQDNGEIALPDSIKRRLSISASPSPSPSASPSPGPPEDEEDEADEAIAPAK
jgi:hypothetical protein